MRKASQSIEIYGPLMKFPDMVQEVQAERSPVSCPCLMVQIGQGFFGGGGGKREKPDQTAGPIPCDYISPRFNSWFCHLKILDKWNLEELRRQLPAGTSPTECPGTCLEALLYILNTLFSSLFTNQLCKLVRRPCISSGDRIEFFQYSFSSEFSH